MKKILVLLSAVIPALLAVPSLAIVFAQEICPNGYENLCKINVEDNPGIFRNVIHILIIVAIVLSVAFLVWGGIKWIMAGGDKGKIEQARAIIIGAIIGLVIAFFAYFIVTVVVFMFTGQGMDIPIPKLV